MTEREKVTLVKVQAEISDHASAVADLFFGDPKVTILIRNSSIDNADMVVSDDIEDLDVVIKTLERLKKKDLVR